MKYLPDIVLLFMLALGCVFLYLYAIEIVSFFS